MDIKLKNNKTNRTCVLIWNYLKINPTSTNSETEHYLDKTMDNHCTLKHCLKKLTELGCLRIVRQEKSGREFTYSTKEFLLEPVIDMDIMNYSSNTSSLLCVKCGNLVYKSVNSKINDLCLDCTRLLYMTPKTTSCCLCKEKLSIRHASRHKGDLYHKICKDIVKNN